MVAGIGHAQEISAGATAQTLRGELFSLDDKVQSLQKSAADINRDLTILEEEAQFPEKSRISAFLGMDHLPRFDLHSVDLKLDGKTVSAHAYTPEEKSALRRGGMHRIHIGKLSTGEHRLVAAFTGKTPTDPQYSNTVSFNFRKEQKPKAIVLNISDLLQDDMPEITAREIR